MTVQKAHKTRDGLQQYRVTYVDHTGKRQRVVMGSRREAEAAAAPLIKASYESKAFGWKPVPVATMATVAQLHTDRKREIPSSYKYRERWPKILAFFGPEKPARSVSPGDVMALRRWLLSLPTGKRRGDDTLFAASLRGEDPWGDRPRMNSSTANRYMETLHAAFKLAMEDKLVDENPVKPSHFAKDKPRDRVPEGDEFVRMLDASTPIVRLAAVIASETCLRRSNIVELSWRDLDLERRTMSVADTKAGVSVLAPLSKVALTALKAWRELRPVDDAFVFPLPPHVPERDRAKHLAKRVTKEWLRSGRRLGIDNLHFHDLRRMAATKMLAAGVPLDVVMKIGGWTRPDVLLRVYAKIDDSRIMDALARIDFFNEKRAAR